MIASWMLYTLLVGGLVCAAAFAAERALLLLRFPVRGVWATALGLSLLIPCLAHYLPRSVPIPPVIERVMQKSADLVSPPKLLTWPYRATPEPARVRWERVLLIGWAAVSLGLAQLILCSMAVLHGRRREWRRVTVDGLETLVAPDFGPAVVGWRRLEIVLPAWALTLPGDARALVVRHEQEHLRQRDPRLLIHAALVVLAMPWNPALWWQYRRLRRAIELDCDARVVRGGADVARYGEVLLEAGGFCRRGGLPALTAFAERASDLEARIKALTPGSGRWRTARVGAAVLAAGAMVAAAGLLPDPLSPSKKVPGEPMTPSASSFRADTSLTAWARLQLRGGFTTNRDVALFRSHEGRFLGSRTIRGAVDRMPPDIIESIQVLKGPKYGVPNVGAVVVITLKAGKQLGKGMDDSFRRYVLCFVPVGHTQLLDPSCR
jgi:beta-lactamase regulating signal transducer with metallopeptidase domain